MYIYRRRQFVYFKETAEKIRSLKRKFNIKNDLYVFISKEEEQRCKIYLNILENETFEKKKKLLEERNERESKCKITFSKRANAEFAFLVQNVEFTESKLRAAARKMKMDLQEFMAYYSHKKKLYMEAKAKEQVLHLQQKQNTAVKRRIEETIKSSKNELHMKTKAKEQVVHSQHKQNTAVKRRVEETIKSSKKVKHTPQYKELRVCLTKIDMEVSLSHVYTCTHITTKREKKIESSEITAIPSKNEFCFGKKEDIVPEIDILPERKIKDERVSRTHKPPRTATKRKISDAIEKTRKIPRNLQSMHSIEKNKKRGDNTHLSPSDAPSSDKEQTLLHPGLLSFDQREKHPNCVDYNSYSMNEKIESTAKIATAPSENLSKKSEREEGDGLHLCIYPEKFSVGKIEDHYACAEEVAKEVSSMYTKIKTKECVANTVSDVEPPHTHSEIKKGETERTMEIPQSLQEDLYSYMHSIEKNNESDNMQPLPLQSFDEIRKVSNSVEVIEFFKERIENSEIGGCGGANEEIIPENIQKREEDLPPHVFCDHPVSEESAGIYISEETVTNIEKERYRNKLSHVCVCDGVCVCAHLSEGTEISESDTVDRLSFHMYSTEENDKRIYTHPSHDSPKERERDDEEITELSFDEPGEKRMSSVEDIEHVFPPESTEIASENCLRERKENSFEYFSEKLVGIFFEEDLHTPNTEQSSGREIPEDPRASVCANPAEESPPSREEISEDPLSYVFVNPAEEETDMCIVPEDTHSVLQCENVPDDDLAFLLPKDYVRDFVEGDEITGGYFSPPPLSHSKQYEDISSDSVLSLPDDHTYDVGDNCAPSCSVEDHVPVLQSENIKKNDFVCARKKNIWAPNKKNIVESFAPFTPLQSDFTIHPPFINKIDETNVIWHENTNVTVTFLPLVFENSDEKEVVVVLNENEWDENYQISNIHTHKSDFAAHPPFNNNVTSVYGDSDEVIILSEDDEISLSVSNNSEQIGQPPHTSIVESPTLSDFTHTVHPHFSNEVDKTYGIWHTQKSIPLVYEDTEVIIVSDDESQPPSIVESSIPTFISDFTVYPSFFDEKAAETSVFGIKKKTVTVSLPSVYEKEVVVFNENEWNDETFISKNPSKGNYHYSNYQPSQSDSVPNYNASSFYDILSSEVLEDKM